MKKIALFLSILAVSFLISEAQAQSPEGFIYQAEIRKNKGTTLNNTAVQVDIKILPSSDPLSVPVWQRLYDVTTDSYGMISVMVGDDDPPQNPVQLFSSINWSNGAFYLYVEVDDGKKKTSIGEPERLFSVPYALHAKTAGNAIDIEGLNPGDILQYNGSGFVAATFTFYYQDNDGDGFGNENTIYSPIAPTGYIMASGDCDDNDSNIHPGAVEECDGQDNDCDDIVDEGCDNDDDGHTADVDCDDNNSEVYPGAPELCDGIDNNCDEQIDETCDCIDGQQRQCDGIGECGVGIQTCINGVWSECEYTNGPSPEICDGLDNDCDGDIDEECQADVHIELTWDTPADPDQMDNNGADLDLHLKQTQQEWNSIWDCYFANPNPNWGNIDSGDDDPLLELDDSDGAGPEIINFSYPENIQYTLGIHYTDDEGYGSSFATVKVFVSGILQFRKDNIGMEKGDFLEVAIIENNLGNITITELTD